jgi:uracil-DNA glycosylase
MTAVGLDGLLAEVRACTACAALLPHAPRPIVQAARSARVLIIGQAPGSKVHASGVPWDDDSGDRLRDWTGLSREVFYDPAHVALLPMGFCYPGKGISGDLPPRPECAPLWHTRLLAALPEVQLTLLVGRYAQARYLKLPHKQSLTETVRALADCAGPVIALPHPAWRVRMWLAREPWFEAELLPALRMRIAAALSDG